MPRAKGDHRRSLFVPDNAKRQRALKVENSRPKSWCVPASISVDLDPYASFRKIFHDFSYVDKYDVTSLDVDSNKFHWKSESDKEKQSVHDICYAKFSDTIKSHGYQDNNNNNNTNNRIVKGHRELTPLDSTSNSAKSPQSPCRNILRRRFDFFKFRNAAAKNKRNDRVEGNKQTQHCSTTNSGKAPTPANHPSNNGLNINKNHSYGNNCYEQPVRSGRIRHQVTDVRPAEVLPQYEGETENHGDVIWNNITTHEGSGYTTTSGKKELVAIIPWTKRMDLMRATRTFCGETVCRRGSKRYSSLRSSTLSYNEDYHKHSLKRSISSESRRSDRYSMSVLRRHNTERIKRSANSTLQRCNSDGGSFSRRRLSQTINTDRKTDSYSTYNRKSSQGQVSRRKTVPNFFTRYRDDIREGTITTAPISSCDSMKFMEMVDIFEYLLDKFLAKPVSKTCKQLYYIRSRLSKHARLNDSMCDGCFGCEQD